MPKSQLKPEMIHFALQESFVGLMLVATTKVGVCAVLLGDDRCILITELHRRFPRAVILEDESVLQYVLQKIVHYLENQSPAFYFPLDIRGTPFQRTVWQQLLTIPYATTVTYSDIADKLNMPTATRAVANACGANHIAILIPCHRVIKRDGSLSGYRWGVERKKALLAYEISKVIN